MKIEVNNEKQPNSSAACLEFNLSLYSHQQLLKSLFEDGCPALRGVTESIDTTLTHIGIV